MKRLCWLTLSVLAFLVLVLPGASFAQQPDEGWIGASRLNQLEMSDLHHSLSRVQGKSAPSSALAAAPLGKEVRSSPEQTGELLEKGFLKRKAVSPRAAEPDAVTAGKIYGRVTYQGNPVAVRPLELRFWDGNTYYTLRSIETAGDGSYSFVDVPSLGPNQRYYVRFVNTRQDPNYVSGWYSYEIDSYQTGSDVAGGDFDIANVLLASPPPSISTGLPTTFQWAPRSATPTDNYALLLFEPSGQLEWQAPGQGYVGSYSLESLPSGFQLMTKYGWQALAFSPDGGVGFSYFYREITFVPPGISGKVTFQGAGASNVRLALHFWNGNSYSTLQTTTTTNGGAYTFSDVPTLGENQSYYVRFVNSANSSYLSGWYSYQITTYTLGSAVGGGDFDIANVVLTSPLSGAKAHLPATFKWGRRTASPTDNYRVELFDPALAGTLDWFSPGLGYASSFTLDDLPPGFRYGMNYGWAVLVGASTGD